VTGVRPEAVIFDWGGTLTRWHDIDFHAEGQALAAAVVGAEHHSEAELTDKLLQAGDVIWGRSRDRQESARIEDLFDEAGLDHDPELLSAYREFWEPHTQTDPEVGPLWQLLRDRGLKVGVLSNTLWPRQWHREFFARDGVLDLIDGDVYSSEIRWTKPAPEAFEAARAAVGVEDPAACVYVGDRLFEDVWGPQQVGMRSIFVPHSTIPQGQLGHSEGEPDAVVHGLAEIAGVLDEWLTGP
jgi:putative hydrolase of the HAD superfamily